FEKLPTKRNCSEPQFTSSGLHRRGRPLWRVDRSPFAADWPEPPYLRKSDAALAVPDAKTYVAKIREVCLQPIRSERRLHTGAILQQGGGRISAIRYAGHTRTLCPIRSLLSAKAGA